MSVCLGCGGETVEEGHRLCLSCLWKNHQEQSRTKVDELLEKAMDCNRDYFHKRIKDIYLDGLP